MTQDNYAPELSKKKNEIVKPAERTHWLALKGQSWGKGETKDAAKKKLREVTSARGPITLYRVPEDYWIDEYGTGHGSASAEFVSGRDLRSK